MRLSRRARGAMAVAVAVSVAAAGGCAGDEKQAVVEAMRLVPGDAGLVRFYDVAGVKARLGFEGVTSASQRAEIEDYTEALLENPWTVPSVRNSPGVQDPQKWGWNGLDVTWQVEATDEQATTLVKLRDGVDMETVMDGFRNHGYDEGQVAGRPHFSVDLAHSEPVPGMLEVTVLPDRHVLVTGNADSEAVIEVADGERASTADDEVAARLLDRLDAPEFLYLRLGDRACVRPPTGEAAASARDADGGERHADLRSIEAFVGAVEVTGDEPEITVTLSHADDDSAESDAPARQSYLESARDSEGRPYDDLFAVADVVVDGSTVEYRLDFRNRPAYFLQTLDREDLPWAVCPES